MSADVQQIIDRILADPRFLGGAAFTGRVFSDEPILRRGSQMAGYLPERYREMRKIATSPEARSKPEALVFLRQAQFMEDFADDVPYAGTFEQYFPTYQAMSNRQLRGYFTWRTAVRAGDVRETSTSFAFVHLYELLMGVGTTPGVEGFHAIERFWQAYRQFEPRLDRYVKTWLRDYAVWHGLDRSLLDPYVDLDFDRALTAMRDGLAGWDGGEPRPLATPAGLIGGNLPARGAASPISEGPATGGRKPSRGTAGDGADNPVEEELFSAFDGLSSYRPRLSRLHRDRPDTLRHVSCAVVVQLSHHYDRHRKTSLMESLFGSPLAMPYEMFASAVFWGGQHPDATYELDEVNRYTCARGRWYWEGYHGSRQRSPKLGIVLRAVDQRLRDAIGYAHPLSEKAVPKYLGKIIDREIAARLAWEREREARTIHVDLSRLDGIRAAASHTREALLIDEEREGAGDAPLVAQATLEQPAVPAVAPVPDGSPTPAPAGTPPLAAAQPATAPTPACTPAPVSPDAPAHDVPPAPVPASASPLGLSPEELGLLRSLLDGTPYEPPAGTTLDMLVDDVNERLFDLLGDTALEFDASGRPAIIEDYLEDVRGAING